jgi:endonuclease/exonuclease/phosphatase family metal-dependent hydrolase
MRVKIFNKFFKIRKLNIFLKIVLILNFITCLFLLLSYLAAHISPATINWLPFFGLSFPFIFIPVLCFLFFWLILRNKWLLLSLFTILLGLNHVRHFYQITLWSGPKNETSTKLKVMSYNVRLFDLYNWVENKETRNEIFKILKRENADIYCFQEFYYSEESPFTTRDTLVKFLKTKNYHEGYTHYVPNGKHHFGLATFSTYPIVKKEMIIFENDPNNCVIISDIKIDNDTIRVFNAHLASIRFQKADYDYVGDAKTGNLWNQFQPKEQQIYSRLKNAFINRSKQIETLSKKVNESPYPVIVCGDFNDTPVSYTYRTITRNLYDAFVESGNGIGQTYIGKFPSFRIDYILYSKELHAYDFQTLPEELSDHHAITSWLEVLD